MAVCSIYKDFKLDIDINININKLINKMINELLECFDEMTKEGEKMANNQNLLKGNEKHTFTPEELSKGGKASAKARRERKMIAEQMKLLLSLPVTSDKLTKQIQSLGFENSEINNQLAMVVSVYQEALKGNMKAVEILRDTIGEKPKEEVNVEGTINNPFSGMTTDELRKIIDG